MRRSVVTLLLLVCFQLLNPSPAHAWWRFIDELSGPGPFHGPDLQWRVVCFGGESERLTTTEARVKAVAAALLESGCLLGPASTSHRASINFEAGWLWSVSNNLQYATPVDRSLHVTILEPAASVNLDRDLGRNWIELGAGIGAITVSGPAFGSFTRVFVDAVRLDVRPFAERGRLDALILRGMLTVFPEGFTATDFGAIPGTYQQGQEVRLSVAASWDFRRNLLK